VLNFWARGAREGGAHLCLDNYGKHWPRGSRSQLEITQASWSPPSGEALSKQRGIGIEATVWHNLQFLIHYAGRWMLCLACRSFTERNHLLFLPFSHNSFETASMYALRGQKEMAVDNKSCEKPDNTEGCLEV